MSIPYAAETKMLKPEFMTTARKHQPLGLIISWYINRCPAQAMGQSGAVMCRDLFDDSGTS